MHLPFESHAHLSTMAPGVVSAGMLMKAMSARESNNAFGLPIDTARQEPVTIEKHGRPVIVVMSFEEYQRLTGNAADETTETHGQGSASRAK